MLLSYNRFMYISVMSVVYYNIIRYSISGTVDKYSFVSASNEFIVLFLAIKVHIIYRHVDPCRSSEELEDV